MTALRDATNLGSGRLDPPVGRGTAILPLLLTGATLLSGVVSDDGTRVERRTDYRPAIEATSLNSFRVEGPVVPFRAPTRMARIRAVAPLSYRDWAPVFGVSHAAIKQWVDGEEPQRNKLDRVLGALHEAAIHRADIPRWLVSELPGMGIRPLDLLRDDRWRAFRGAIRTRYAPSVDLEPTELTRRRQAQVSWASPEPVAVTDET